jgi:hypothetical protein
MGSGSMRRSRRVKSVSRYAPWLGACLVACDIVQGFQHAGDALFPPVKTYLDVPGYRLVDGGYRNLDFVAGRELYLLARSSRDDDHTLFSMRYADPKPCALPDVARYWADSNSELTSTWIAYFHEDTDRGTLRFADPGCRPSELVIEDAQLPFGFRTWQSPNGPIDPESSRNVLVRAGPGGGTILVVDPGQATVETLLEGAGHAVHNVGSSRLTFVASNGRLAVFDGHFRFIDWIGENVVSFGAHGSRLYFEDAGGIQRVNSTPAGDDSATVSTMAIAADGCALAFPSSERKIAYFSPCAERRVMLWNDSTSVAVETDLATDPRLLMLLPDPKPKPDASGPLATSFAYYLRDVDYDVGVGTLLMRARGGEEVVIGANAAFERTSIDASGEYGYALVDVTREQPRGTTGRFVRWELDGSTSELATNTLRDAAGAAWATLLIDWTGTHGTLAQVHDGVIRPIMERAPSRRQAYDDGEYVVLFNDFDGENGTLSIGTEVCPDPPGCSARYYTPVPIAYNVHQNRHRLLNESDDFLPGIGYLTDYDPETDTGRFEYRNLELQFTSIVNEGVSEFLVAGNGILYAVPFGERPGIWLTRAK